ncbi:MAG: DUF928 domain-containing protein [Cyanobacteria bacterium P01_F01_bin.143]
MTTLINLDWREVAIAQENSHYAKEFKVTFNPPKSDKPQNTQGAASRHIKNHLNNVANADLPLVPLIPTSAKGLTVSSHPTVLAYLPETSADKILFSWRDEQNNDHYQIFLPLNHPGGVISLTLPEDAPPLEVGKNYHWALAIIPDTKLKPDTPTIEGQIQRVTLESAIRDRLEVANPLETAVIYGEAGIWYETVATLAQLTTAAPDDNNLKSNWEYLLTSVGLEKISQVPTNSN